MHDAICNALQEVLWTVVCLADDDPLCKETVTASGALSAVLPLLATSPFDDCINDFVCLPALAARALHVLAEDNNSPASLQSDISNDRNEAEEERNGWQQAAVPHLIRMLSRSATDPQDAKLRDIGSQHLLRSSSGLNQRLRKCGTFAHSYVFDIAER